MELSIYATRMPNHQVLVSMQGPVDVSTAVVALHGCLEEAMPDDGQEPAEGALTGWLQPPC